MLCLLPPFFLQEAATKMIFVEIESCYDSHPTVLILFFVFSHLWALLQNALQSRAVLQVGSEPYLLRGLETGNSPEALGQLPFWTV